MYVPIEEKVIGERTELGSSKSFALVSASAGFQCDARLHGKYLGSNVL